MDQEHQIVSVGDKVVINLEKDILEQLQSGHGGWNDDMKNYIGKKGKVKSVDADGDVLIRFAGAEYLYNSACVTKVLSKGDIVKISTDLEKAKLLQDGHGDWVPAMTNILGRTGTVLRRFPNLDVFVEFDRAKHCLNPLLCTVIKSSAEDSSSDDDDHASAAALMLSRLIIDPFDLHDRPAAMAQLPNRIQIVVKLTAREESQQLTIKSPKDAELPCLLCSEMKQLVKFEPCGHLKMCVECYNRNKQIKICMECRKDINDCTLPQTKGVKSDHDFQPGDKVFIDMDERLFTEQEAKYNSNLEGLLAKIGIVGACSMKDKVHVRFEGKGSYLIPPEILKKSNVMKIEEL